MAGQASQPAQVLAKVRTRAATLRAPVIPLKDDNPTSTVRGRHGRCSIAINVARVLRRPASAQARAGSEFTIEHARDPVRGGAAAAAHRCVEIEPPCGHLGRGVRRRQRPTASRTARRSPTRTSTWPCSTRCSCTAACCTSAATCCSSGSSATTSRTSMGRVRYLALLPAGRGGRDAGPRRRPARQHGAARSARRAPSPA